MPSLCTYVLLVHHAQTSQKSYFIASTSADMDCRSCNPCARDCSGFHGRYRIWQELFHQGSDGSQRYRSWAWLNVKYVPTRSLSPESSTFCSLTFIPPDSATESVTSYRC